MKRSIHILAVLLVVLTVVGCRQQAADSAVDLNDSDTSILEPNTGTFARHDLGDRQLPAGLTRDTPPEQIVAAFLAALRSGDSSVAEALLTSRAHQETRKRNLTLQEIGSPHAEFTVGVPEYLGTHKNGARVNTAWTERKGGEVISYDVIWALRRQNTGWRVAGMGAQLEPGQPVVYLNFEDPDDMLAKWRAADEAIAAEQTYDPGIRQAGNIEPAGGFQR